MVSEKQKNVKKAKGLVGWIKELLLFLVIAMVIGFAIDLWRSQSMVSGKVPDLIETSIQGEKIDLALMSQEKPVLVYFWATWCPVCSSVSPSVDYLSNHYQVVTVALTSGEPQLIKRYLQAKEYDFSVINDPKGVISRHWGVSVTPTIFIIDKGEVSSVTTGFTSPLGIWLRLLFA